MPLPSTRFALLAFCLLPALAVNVPARHSNVVASFIFSCDASDPEPRLRTTWSAPGRPRPRAKSAKVEVFEPGVLPSRKFEAIGEVSVLASGSRTSVEQLTNWAIRGARKLGGDALVNVNWDDAASMKPKAGPVGLLCLTATVVRWTPEGEPDPSVAAAR